MSRYRPALLPAAVGLLAALLWQLGAAVNPILHFRADLGSLFFIAGLSVTAGWCIVVSAREETRQRYQRMIDQLNIAQADSHRRFIRRLDHEVKNPLTAIRAAAANLSETESSGVSAIRGQVDRLARLTADLRKLADLETLAVEREPVDLTQLLNELIALGQEREDAADRKVCLALPQAPWPLPPVAGDRDLLFLALHNLLDNALKYSRPGDTIEMRMYEDGSSVVIQIADTGPGVGEDELVHLGEELYRGEGARTAEGSGLGLALVKAIVARHHGAVSIRSRLGQGTVVQLRLPVVAA